MSDTKVQGTDKKSRYMPEEIVMAILFFLLLFFGGINVILRYCFNTAIPFVNDMMVDVFVWLSIIGLPVACYRGVNMSLTLVYDMLPFKLRKACIIIAGIISVCLFSYLFITGTKILVDQIKFNHTTSVPFIPKWFWTTAFPVGAGLYVVRAIQSTVYSLKTCSEVNERTLPGSSENTARGN
jgi:TRAP-type C4-dicarboxylate transport system permease small subunit